MSAGGVTVKRKLNLTAAAALAALALAGCGETVIDREPPTPEYASPATVLKAVQISFNQRNIDYLKQSLSPNFIFYFDPRDVGHSPPYSRYIIPESWSHDEFLNGAGHMLEMAYSIDFSINTTGVGTPAENETTYRADNVTLSLLVYIDEVNGCLIDGGYCDFAFERYATEKGERLWRLNGWWDHTSLGYDEGAAASPASLGRVLAMYYRE
jgi:hypothetical protein